MPNGAHSVRLDAHKDDIEDVEEEVAVNRDLILDTRRLILDRVRELRAWGMTFAGSVMAALLTIIFLLVRIAWA